MRRQTTCEPAAGERRDPPGDPERHPPPGRAESRRDGAGPAVEELTPAVGIHPERGVGAAGEQHRATGQSGETDVLRVPIADGLVPADLVVAEAPHREHRPERHGRVDTLAEHGERTRSHQRGHVEQQAGLFVPALGAVPRLHRHHGVGMHPRHGLDVVEELRRREHVGVDEQQRRARRWLRRPASRRAACRANPARAPSTRPARHRSARSPLCRRRSGRRRRRTRRRDGAGRRFDRRHRRSNALRCGPARSPPSARAPGNGRSAGVGSATGATNRAANRSRTPRGRRLSSSSIFLETSLTGGSRSWFPGDSCLPARCSFEHEQTIPAADDPTRKDDR